MGAARLAGWLLLFALLPAWAGAQPLQPIPPLDSPVVDTTGTLDAATRQALEAQARTEEKIDHILRRHLNFYLAQLPQQVFQPLGFRGPRRQSLACQGLV